MPNSMKDVLELAGFTAAEGLSHDDMMKILVEKGAIKRAQNSGESSVKSQDDKGEEKNLAEKNEQKEQSEPDAENVVNEVGTPKAESVEQKDMRKWQQRNEQHEKELIEREKRMTEMFEKQHKDP